LLAKNKKIIVEVSDDEEEQEDGAAEVDEHNERLKEQS